jgi:hypothetical protein
MQLKKIGVFLMGVCAAYGGAIVVPGGNAAVDGNTDNSFPFNNHARYQQVYGSTAFGGSPILITGVDFRPDGPGGFSFSSTLTSIQIDLSTTSTAVDALSLTFAANVGADDVTVYALGSLALSSAASGPPGGPDAFDIHIQFTTPFLYNPASGNLLLDVRNIGGGSSEQYDAQQANGDSISRVLANIESSPTGDFADSTGLVTRFDTAGGSSVPEPTTALLSAAGLAAAFALRRARR